MKIQAINSAMSVNNCQPVKQVEFARKKSPEIELASVLQEDVCSLKSSQDVSVTEQKYNLACLLAAYYKTQYEQLLEQNGCFV